MIDTLAAICLTLWALGLAISYSMGGFIHLFLLPGITVVLFRLLQLLRRRPLGSAAAEDPVPEPRGHAVAQGQAGGVMMPGVPALASPQPAAVAAAVVDRVMAQGIGQVSAQHTQAQRAGAPRITEQQRRQEYQRGYKAATEDGRRADARRRSLVMLRVPASERLRSVQQETVQPVLDGGPAEQAAQH